MMNKVSYYKPFLSFEEQARLLEDRGLLIGSDENRRLLIDFLRNLNFYRLDGYCRRYYGRNLKKHKFIEGHHSLEYRVAIMLIKKIRIYTFEMIQDFEISLRSQFVDVLGSRYGIYPYARECYHARKE